MSTTATISSRISEDTAAAVGGSDSRWYRMHGVPTVVYGLTPFNMGGPDEHIMVDELKTVAKVHTLAAFDFLTNHA